MVKMDQYELIRTANRVYGKGIREIAREYGHHRETIRKALRGRGAWLSPERSGFEASDG